MTAGTSRTAGQEQALEELRRIASAGPALQVLRVWRRERSESVFVDISVDCSNLQTATGGVRLRMRERLTLGLPPQFPFAVPTASTPHTRWAKVEHVQWGRHLCLYVSPATEWNPSDGMAGFVERLMSWLERAAVGQLDAPGEPLHPPVAYPSDDAGLVVIRADAPRAANDLAWLGVALLRRVDQDRVDLVGWRGLADSWPGTAEEARSAVGVGDGMSSVRLAFAVVLPRPIAFEYPQTAAAMVESLSASGVSAELMLGLLGVVANHNRDLASPDGDQRGGDDAPEPLYLVVGAPARGIVGDTQRLTHLVVWRLPPLAERIARLALHRYSDDPQLAEIGREVLEIGRDWLAGARTAWARVYEARAEIVTRRDAQASASWLVGKRVLVLGAGALGSPIAEACVRGGTARVVVADRGVVQPGILVRQPYDDDDIGQAKALVLARQLRRIRPEADVEPWVGDVTTTMFDEDAATPEFDLVIDATADRTVRTVIERRRAAQRAAWPAVATVLIGHQATRGIATVAHSGSSGAGMDLLRRLSLAARTDATGRMNDIVEDFFPDPPRTTMFQPEPGCSDVTFVGSAGDVIGLAGQLLTGVLHVLQHPSDDSAMVGLVVRMPAAPDAPATGPAVWFRWPNDTVLRTVDDRHEVRLAASALAEMRAEARRGARVREPRVETGGSLLGGFDAAAGVVWVDEATGPPPDSLLSEVHFQHGTIGVEDRIAARRTATARVTTFVGMWHTHPYGPAAPSPTDEEGMRELVLPVAKAPPRALLLIASGQSQRWRAWLAGDAAPHWYARVVERADGESGSCAPTRVVARLVGVRWWPGGYATRTIDDAASDDAASRQRPTTRRWWRRRRGEHRT